MLENCLCRECSMSTTLLEFLHISLTFNMTEGKSLMVRRIEWHWFIWTLVTLPPLKYIEIYIHFFQYMFLYACWFIDKVTYAYRFPTSISGCIQVKNDQERLGVYKTIERDFKLSVRTYRQKKNGRKVLTRVFDFIQFIRSSGSIKVMLATNPIIVGRFSWYLALPPREHH